MKTFLILFLTIVVSHIPGFSQYKMDQNISYSSLKGSYLGQKSPNGIAELFAPGIICTEEDEALYGIFNNGSYIIFDRIPNDFQDWANDPIYVCKKINDNWTSPVLSEYKGKPWYFNYPNPKNNEEIFYAWWLPLGEDGSFININIWKVNYKEDHWSEPEKLQYPINTEYFDTWPSVNNDGILYFFSNREGGFGNADIYRSIPEKGKYKSVENLGPIINTAGLEHDPCISADGSFLIYSSDRKGSLGKDDLFVVFQIENEKWTYPINLGEIVNTEASENRPYLTKDGKYLFFTSTRNGNLDIFWINSEVIKDLKPE